MYITDFLNEHISQAANLSLMAYQEEQNFVQSLPWVESVPDLTVFANNRLGVAAFENNKMIGFLCCYSPFDHAFNSTDVKGVFSPMGANAAIRENRARIYAAMYQAAAEKWVKGGAVSHAVCLYAHDAESQKQFYQYGFGLRCIDSIRSMKSIDCKPCTNYDFTELSQKEYHSVYPLQLALNSHYRESPFFMNHEPDTPEQFKDNSIEDGTRYFAAEYNGELCAYLKIIHSGETFAANGSTYCHINGAYCLPQHRGTNLFQNLLNYAILALETEGYTRIGVDFESMNPNASGFWLKYFTAYTHSVVRRIDERILSQV